MKKINSLEALVAACVDARKQFEGAAVRYLEFLSDVERDHESLWKPACGSFAKFVEQYVGLPRTSSWTEFKASLEAMGIEYVRACGAEAAAVATRIESPDKRNEYAAATAAWVKMHDGVHPSRETANKLRLKVDPKGSEPRAVGQVRELEELRAENAELKRKVHTLEREIDKLRKQVGKSKATQPSV
jgi:hypothetical protein